ncbi:MAG: hydrogen gas-evolving membrane-bound hydrogenase subunit E [Opitutales bacterium]
MPITLIASLCLVFGAALLAPLVCRLARGHEGWVLALAPALAFGMLALQIPYVSSGVNVVWTADWFSTLGASAGLRLDGLSLLMALLVLGIGTLIVIYAGGYLHGHAERGRFFLYLLAFMGAMQGVALADNLLLLFIFWELTSITSYLLIGFEHESKTARWNALQALLVTGLGAMAMLAGFILIAVVTGSYSIAEINKLGPVLRESPYYTAIAVLILGGAFTKSAQVPFHFWLPNAMTAPTPVSAFLHSATMVKAGVFLLARLNPGLGGTELWFWSLSIVGSATLLLAVGLGLFHTDLKRILAYTTLAVLGLLTLLIGLGTEVAIKGMVVFLVAHVLYKAALFMAAGAIDHETGTRNVTLLRGLRGIMPVTAVAAVLAVLSKSGVPPFFGFMGKEVVYEAGLGMEGVALVFLGVAFVGNFLIMALALNAGLSPFLGKPDADLPKPHPHEAPLSLWLGPLLLGLAGLAFGLFPGLVSGSLVGPAVAAVEGHAHMKFKLELWHGFNLPLLFSALTLACGVTVFLLRRRFWAVGDRVLAWIRPRGAEAAYEGIFNATMLLAKKQTRWIQTGRLHDYVFIIVATTVGLLAWGAYNFGGFNYELQGSAFDLLVAGVIVLMLVATVVAVVANDLVTVLVGLGTVGFGVAVLFAFYGAPDLAITQLMVEVLVVVLFMFVVYRLPKPKNISNRLTRFRDLVLATAFGASVFLLVMKAWEIQFNETISTRLAEMSYPEAHGKNVVNVILVDFRALDTLGEITVIAIAALGISALVAAKGLKTKRSEK